MQPHRAPPPPRLQVPANALVSAHQTPTAGLTRPYDQLLCLATSLQFVKQASSSARTGLARRRCR
ncbi:hypothetical protein BCR35DRAFT_307924 [Leucosporidium creatinivorum]|uniref:Uncharacterized protein n=1 Tax=Leucosporidium creatinivorum TaxID=106004 RepID=A0A1Y2EH90_9BASI|nr:hypothetical protein BCR35DRAFT_307924 [Leucosporidium creatinivorum]